MVYIPLFVYLLQRDSLNLKLTPQVQVLIAAREAMWSAWKDWQAHSLLHRLWLGEWQPVRSLLHPLWLEGWLRRQELLLTVVCWVLSGKRETALWEAVVSQWFLRISRSWQAAKKGQQVPPQGLWGIVFCRNNNKNFLLGNEKNCLKIIDQPF